MANTLDIDLKTIKVDDRDWRYRISSPSGQTLILLPGALGSGDLLVRHVSELLPEIGIIAPEYSPAKSIAEFVIAFDSILAVENIEKPILYGGSFGGILAQCWARKHPQTFQCLILSGTGKPYPRRIPSNRFLLKILPLIPISLIRWMMNLAAKRMSNAIPQNQSDWLEYFRKQISEIQKEDLESRYRTAIDFDSNFIFQPEDLASLPVLLLEGSEDQVANKRIRTAMRKLYPQATTKTIEKAGHSLMLSHSDQWRESIRTFLEKI